MENISASQVTLYDLEQHFQLRLTDDNAWFYEWQDNLPSLTLDELQRLNRIKAAVANLEKRSFLENTVKLAVIAPLLDLTGLFFPPFYVSTEDVVAIEAIDRSIVVQGRLDILVLKEQFWLLVIESKRAEFSLKVGIPQVLSYMLASPQKQLPLYGLVSNGTNFVFLKMMFDNGPCYAKSRQFILEQDKDLAVVLKILKKLAGIVGDAQPSQVTV